MLWVVNLFYWQVAKPGFWITRRNIEIKQPRYCGHRMVYLENEDIRLLGAKSVVFATVEFVWSCRKYYDCRRYRVFIYYLVPDVLVEPRRDRMTSFKLHRTETLQYPILEYGEEEEDEYDVKKKLSANSVIQQESTTVCYRLWLHFWLLLRHSFCPSEEISHLRNSHFEKSSRL